MISFQVNSFEQLCINFCNEKLQFHFNEHIFRMEQNLYQSEGISIPGTAFVDNQPTLDLLEAKVTGVFSMADEEINVPRGSDDGLLQKILMKHADGKHPNMIRPKAKDCKDFLKNFGILHYAGPVFYNISNFLEKNKDQLHPDIISVLQNSSVDIIRNMFPVDTEASTRSGGKASNNKKTLGFQFKTQLNELIATLNSTFPHFVRCMKSNDKKAGNVFTSGRMQDQLRYAGLVEVCRIRKLGFPVRRPFMEFYKRYRCVDLLCPDLDKLLISLRNKGVLKDNEWAKGHSKMFMRTLQSQELELAREHSLMKVATVVQKNARRMIAKRKYKYWMKILSDINVAIQKRVEAGLAAVIDLGFELPHGGAHIKIIKEAKLLLIRLREEKRVSQLLENAIQSRDINSLKSAIAVHGAMSPAFETPLASDAAGLLARLEEELAIKAALITAISSRDRSQLISLTQKAEAMGFTCNEVSQGLALIVRLDQEASLILKLKDSMVKENLDEINAIYSQCMELGLEMYYSKELNDAKEVKTRLIALEVLKEEERKRREAEEEKQRLALEAIEAKRNAQIATARFNLQKAIASKNIPNLNSSLQEAIQIGAHIAEVDEARAMLESLKKLEEVRSQLQAAIRVLQVKVESGINELDLQPLVYAIEVSDKVLLFSNLLFICLLILAVENFW